MPYFLHRTWHSCQVSRMAETVPEFIPTSRLCPGRHKIVLISRNFTNLELSDDSVCSSKENLVDVLEPALDTTLNKKTILVLFSSCATFCFCHTHQGCCVYMLFACVNHDKKIIAENNGCGHKGAWSNFLRMLQTGPGFLIPKLGNYDMASDMAMNRNELDVIVLIRERLPQYVVNCLLASVADVIMSVDVSDKPGNSQLKSLLLSTMLVMMTIATRLHQFILSLHLFFLLGINFVFIILFWRLGRNSLMQRWIPTPSRRNVNSRSLLLSLRNLSLAPTVIPIVNLSFQCHSRLRPALLNG